MFLWWSCEPGRGEVGVSLTLHQQMTWWWRLSFGWPPCLFLVDDDVCLYYAVRCAAPLLSLSLSGCDNTEGLARYRLLLGS